MVVAELVQLLVVDLFFLEVEWRDVLVVLCVEVVMDVHVFVFGSVIDVCEKRCLALALEDILDGRSLRRVNPSDNWAIDRNNKHDISI
jgi:hypothetical protein